MKAASLFGALVLLACPELAGAPAHAQSGRLAPTGGAAEGIISWTCAGMLRVDLSGYRQDGGVTYVTWQFDQDEPQTVYLRKGFSTDEWSWGNQEAARFMSRAKSASRLVIRMLGNPPSASGIAVYTYDLGRSRALRGAGCVDDSTVPPAADWPPPEGLSYESPSDSGGDVTYELSAVEQPPEMLRANEFGRHLSRNYPPSLRDAGTTGTVLVRFRVLKDGRVDVPSIEVVRSPDPLFDAPVLRYLPLLHFRPARVKGRPVKVWVELPVQFAPGA
ncbi:MAG TPA: energy transducer TonB [Longimicrobium sp.]|nr:energy transducer TonB [Longimicrobium sp.]